MTQEVGSCWNGGVDRYAMPDRAVLERPAHEDLVETVQVDGVTFERLLISTRKLERRDSPHTNQLGLYDPGTGICYLVDQAVLFQLIHASAPVDQPLNARAC
jgi:hypothetical protein